MRVLVSGASGVIGTALVAALEERHHDVTRLSRRNWGDPQTVTWDPARGRFNPEVLRDHGAVVHLAGENVGDGRWTAAKKKRIEESRVQGTRLLAQGIATISNGPSILISASAVGYYGSRGDEILTEESGPGVGFLADVCRQWEEAAQPAAAVGARVVFMRNGVVLSKRGGPLARMLPPFKLGVGGAVGNGRQFISWISEHDVVAAFLHVLTNEIAGPVNASSPNPVRNREFAHVLGRVLKRPAVLAIPAFVARLAVGELADEAVLASQRIRPERLLSTGFSFRHVELEDALRAALR